MNTISFSLVNDTVDYMGSIQSISFFSLFFVYTY